MAVSVFSAARYLCEKSNWELTNLKLQKLLYLAHMVHLGTIDPQHGLISNRFEAWDYGPVSPDLYSQVRIFGRGPVKNIFHGVRCPTDEQIRATLDEIYEDVGHLSAGQLVEITHKQAGAWDRSYIPGVRGVPISNDDIKQEYEDRVREANQRSN